MSLKYIMIIAAGLAVWILWLLPICSAFRSGIQWARDPAHRVTPLSPWSYFWRKFRRGLRWWGLAWVVALALAYVFGPRIWNQWEVLPETLRWLLPLRIAALALGAGLTMAGVCFLLAPRFKKALTLEGAALPFALVIFVGAWWALLAAGPLRQTKFLIDIPKDGISLQASRVYYCSRSIEIDTIWPESKTLLWEGQGLLSLPVAICPAWSVFGVPPKKPPKGANVILSSQVATVFWGTIDAQGTEARIANAAGGAAATVKNRGKSLGDRLVIWAYLSLAAFHLLFLSLLFTIACWLLARHRGENWFRFEGIGH